ncbi:hypothetical protein P3X46_002889 [Hevea brasiliensis]|uniref:chorismate mutase n=1 Tax=Hevea brasiliensis TaxID=3981 RepID=A0ABQ9N7W1_HEVBR|nr:hypothetical protein P3X46_002889 [Hevea brasiliensis]
MKAKILCIAYAFIARPDIAIYVRPISHLVHNFPETLFIYAKGGVDEIQSLSLENIRQSLIQQVDSIIFSLLLRAHPDEHPYILEYLPNQCSHSCTQVLKLLLCYDGINFLVDGRKLMEMLTYESVEAAVKKKVEMKAKAFGQGVTIIPLEEEAEPMYKVKPSSLVNLYGNWIMLLTEEVQVE